MKNSKSSFIFPILSLIIAGVLAGWYLNGMSFKFIAKSQQPQIITIIDKVPLGSSYQQVKAQYPNISPLQGQGGYLSAEKSIFTEAFVQTNTLNQPARIKFNFNNDKLYSFFFDFNKLDKQTAEKLFEDITETFSRHYGSPKHQTMELDRENCHTNAWQSKNFALGTSITTTDNQLYYVSAGFQNTPIDD